MRAASAFQAIHLGAGGLFGHVQPVPLQTGAVQQGRGDGVLLPRGLQRLLSGEGGGLGGGGGGRGFGDGGVGRAQFGGGGLCRQPRVVPADEQQRGLKGADLGGDLLVFLGLTRLALQPVQRRLQLAADVVQPVQIGLGRLQPQLGLVPTGVQARDPARFFQNAAAVLGLGGDQFGNLALTHQGGGVGAGRGVGEQQLDVAGPHLLAVDAIGRALAPVDAARHLQHRAVGKGLGRAALRIVDGQLDFGVAARGGGRRRRRR